MATVRELFRFFPPRSFIVFSNQGVQHIAYLPEIFQILVFSIEPHVKFESDIKIFNL